MTVIRVGLLGLGTVGSQVAQELDRRGTAIAERTGVDVGLARVLVRDREKARAYDPGAERLTTDPDDILDDPSVAIVVELMGGMEPARSYIERAIDAGKAVVTANKEVMAHCGPDVLDRARARGVEVNFEAAVGGGIPLISTLRSALLANEILRIDAIINGTTNFMLDGMARGGASFDDALAEAQRLGYAEADPSYDVEGRDAAFKLAIMSSIAFRSRIDPAAVDRQGIAALDPVDFGYAAELGYTIKLLARARAASDGLELSVQPTCVPVTHLLGAVHGTFNAVLIEGDLVGTLLLYGQGAGGRPTASAAVGGIIEVALAVRKGVTHRTGVDFSRPCRLRRWGEVATGAYLRLHVADRAGALTEVTRVLGELDVSISSIVQKALMVEHAAVELVILTHPTPVAQVVEARRRLEELPAVYAVPACLRVLEAAA